MKPTRTPKPPKPPKPAPPPIQLFITPQIRDEPFFHDLSELDFIPVDFDPKLRNWPADMKNPGVFLIHEDFLLQEFRGMLDLLAKAPETWPIIVIGETLSREYLQTAFIERTFTQLNKPVGLRHLLSAIKSAGQTSQETLLLSKTRHELARAQGEIQDLRAVGLALSAERDPKTLLQMILTTSRQLAQADAASLYLVEPDRGLRFTLTQNASLDWEMIQDQIVPIDETSISGFVALTGTPLNLLDVYFISDLHPFSFNRSFDQRTGYRSKSMVAVAIKNPKDEILGVIQLLNKRSDFETMVPGKIVKEEAILPFNRSDLELLESLASQAAVALENSSLYEDIKNLFEGFVKASITAIESRDPSTFGHSERVAALTIAFAQALHDQKTGPFADVWFAEKNLTEIRYASLLHDFGKVGVREEVLVKAKKLFPWEQSRLIDRFRYLRRSIQADFWRQCYQELRAKGTEAFDLMQPIIEAKHWAQLDELQNIFNFLLHANEPTVLEEGEFHRLLELAGRTYTTHDGETIPLLTDRESEVLSIRRGSLSEEERLEIESHVTHTFNFLSKIPWTRDLRRIPEIAYAHHEKLNGRGYPNHLTQPQIPLESKLMTVCDIYDALTARDRPYKKAIPREKAFDIMLREVQLGLLSGDLLEFFIKGKIFRVIEDRADFRSF